MYYVTIDTEVMKDLLDISGDLTIYLLVILLVVLGILVFYIAAVWKLFKKADKNGWEAVIPFYNTWVLVEIAGLNWWYFLIAISGTILSTLEINGFSTITTLASTVVNFFIFYNLAKRMKKSEVGTAILSIFIAPIVMMVLGFSKAEDDSSIEVSPNGPIETK